MMHERIDLALALTRRLWWIRNQRDAVEPSAILKQEWDASDGEEFAGPMVESVLSYVSQFHRRPAFAGSGVPRPVRGRVVVVGDE
jgi:hypothetical protein